MTKTPDDTIMASLGSPSWPANYPSPDGHRLRMQAYLRHAAELLAKEADSMGFVLTIAQHHADPIPAAGRTINVISITPKRIPS